MLIAAVCVLIVSPHKVLAEEVDDLIQTILEASPVQRSKAAKYPVAKKRNTSTGKKSLVPDLKIPDSQVLDASTKFPNDFVGKYVYGPVIFKGTVDMEGERAIMFDGKNRRMFTLYTQDPKVIAYFDNLKWKTPFVIPRECPLRILNKELFTYAVRMPYDQSNEAYKILGQ